MNNCWIEKVEQHYLVTSKFVSFRRNISPKQFHRTPNLFPNIEQILVEIYQVGQLSQCRFYNHPNPEYLFIS